MTIFLRVFGVFVGLFVILYGVAVMDDALVGTGPCRANCELYRAVLSLVGQSAYNKLIGLLWILAGCSFCAVSIIAKKKGKAKR